MKPPFPGRVVIYTEDLDIMSVDGLTVADIPALLAELATLRDKLERVGELHQPIRRFYNDQTECTECSWVWPCQTAAVLDPQQAAAILTEGGEE